MCPSPYFLLWVGIFHVHFSNSSKYYLVFLLEVFLCGVLSLSDYRALQGRLL